MKKGVMAQSLAELVSRGRAKLGYSSERSLYLVLEDDGTEVDEEDYFATLPPNTTLMLLYSEDRWTPFPSLDTPDHGGAGDQATNLQSHLVGLLIRLHGEPGTVALLSEAELELVAEMDIKDLPPSLNRFSPAFISQLQSAADRHLAEKAQIRDTLGLLKIYHNSQGTSDASGLPGSNSHDGSSSEGRSHRRQEDRRDSPRKRLKANEDIVG